MRGLIICLFFFAVFAVVGGTIAVVPSWIVALWMLVMVLLLLGYMLLDWKEEAS